MKEQNPDKENMQNADISQNQSEKTNTEYYKEELPNIKFSIKDTDTTNKDNPTNSSTKIRKKSRLETFLIDPRILVTIIIVLIFASLAVIIQKANIKSPWDINLKNIPYIPKQIVVTAEMNGIENTPDEGQIWDITLNQISNIYISVYKDETITTNEQIKEIKINNFTFLQVPQIGEVSIKQIPEAAPNENLLESEILYRPQQSKIESNVALYKDGGIIGFRYINNNIGIYRPEVPSNEVVYDGKLAQAANVSAEQLSAILSFDLNIYLESGISYKTNIQVELPINKFMQDGYGLNEYVNFADLEYVKL